MNSDRLSSDRESEAETCSVLVALLGERLERVLDAVGNAAALVLYFETHAPVFVQGSQHHVPAGVRELERVVQQIHDCRRGNRDEPLDHPVLRGEIAGAQRIIEGQNVEIRKTLWRYASAIEGQRRHVMDARQAILHGEEMSEVWKRAPGRRRVLVEDVGEDAVQRAERAVTLFQIDRAWRDHLAFAADLREGIHLVSLGGQDPLTRFTIEIRYRTTVAIDAAVVMMPLLLLWGLVDRFLRKRSKRRGDPFRT